jgi:oligopeptidase B
MIIPKANKIPKELTTNGHTRIDNYFWLNDRENPDVIEYLNKENDYTNAVMTDYSDMKEELFQEIVARIKQTDESVPYKENGYFYYTRYEEKKEYPIYCRRKDDMENVEEIILDVNVLAQGYEYFQVSGLDISKDNKFMVYGVDTVSRRIYTLYFKNLETGQLFDITIPNTTGSVAWANDNKTIFYTTKDQQTLRSDKIFKHKIGTELDLDQLIYVETDDVFGTGVYKTKSDDYLMIVCYSKTSDEYRFLNANTPDGEFSLIQPREKDLEYNIDQYKDKFYIITNFQAKNFRLMETDIANPSKENWREIIAHRPDVFLQNIEVFSKYLVLSERTNGLINLRVIEWNTKQDYYIDFGEEAYTAGIGVNTDFESEYLRFSYSSLTTPGSVYDYNMTTHEKILKKQQEVLGGFNASNYEAKRLYVIARDGIKVPISLVYKKGVDVHGKNPLLLYGYGSYGISIDASFSSVRLSLLDRGFIYVIAHIRGGQELGRQWYEDGKMLNKLNTFNDYIDCAEYLISNNFTSTEKLFAMGGSAGGLLMGAVMNIRPDLFKGVVAVVPFVDVVTTMLDDSIPLTTGEYDEWGNPNEEVYYNYMLLYSPYDNVKTMNYPSMLVMTGLHDSQVQYWEPAKWVAKLRELKTDNNLLLLHTNMSAGHGGASGRFEVYRDTALEYAFMFKILGIRQ